MATTAGLKGGTYTKTFSAWNSSLRQAKHNSAVKEYPAVKSATTKTESTDVLNRSSCSFAYRPGKIR